MKYNSIKYLQLKRYLLKYYLEQNCHTNMQYIHDSKINTFMRCNIVLSKTGINYMLNHSSLSLFLLSLVHVECSDLVKLLVSLKNCQQQASNYITSSDIQISFINSIIHELNNNYLEEFFSCKIAGGFESKYFLTMLINGKCVECSNLWQKQLLISIRSFFTLNSIFGIPPSSKD